MSGDFAHFQFGGQCVLPSINDMKLSASLLLLFIQFGQNNVLLTSNIFHLMKPWTHNSLEIKCQSLIHLEPFFCHQNLLCRYKYADWNQSLP